jgi:hypothetical protein
MVIYVRTIIAGFALILSPVAAEAITFNVIFSDALTQQGTVFTNLSGTIAYTSAGDLAPSDFFFSDGNATFTPANPISGAWDATWSGSTLKSMVTSGSIFLYDNGNRLVFSPAAPSLGVDSYEYDTARYISGALGQVTFTLVPEPSTFLTVALGVLGLGVRRRRAAVR